MNARSNSIPLTHPTSRALNVRLIVEQLYFAFIRPHCFGETCIAEACEKRKIACSRLQEITEVVGRSLGSFNVRLLFLFRTLFVALLHSPTG